MFNCSFCGKTRNEVAILIVGANGYICDECVEVCIGILLENLRNKVSQKVADWIEANSIDPRDEKVYFARVHSLDYPSDQIAYKAAKQRADYLALRGYAKDCEKC